MKKEKLYYKLDYRQYLYQLRVKYIYDFNIYLLIIAIVKSLYRILNSNLMFKKVEFSDKKIYFYQKMSKNQDLVNLSFDLA